MLRAESLGVTQIMGGLKKMRVKSQSLGWGLRLHFNQAPSDAYGAGPRINRTLYSKDLRLT